MKLSRSRKDIRHERILSALEANPALRVAQLAEDLSVSSETIRRDLAELDQLGRIRRTYGGAVRSSHFEPALNERMTIHVPERRAIAQAAMQRYGGMDTLLLGGGATMVQFARALRFTQQRMTVVTPAYAIANELAANPLIEVMMLPGTFEPQEGLVGGPETIRAIARYRTQATIIGASGLDEALNFDAASVKANSVAPVDEGCCGGPAAEGVDACCVKDAEAKASGQPGCGCGHDLGVRVLLAECDHTLVGCLAQVGLCFAGDVGADETRLDLAVGTAPEGSILEDIVRRVGRRVDRCAQPLHSRGRRLFACVARIGRVDRADGRAIGEGVVERGGVLPRRALAAHERPLLALAAVGEDTVAHFAALALTDVDRAALRHAILGGGVGNTLAGRGRRHRDTRRQERQRHH